MARNRKSGLPRHRLLDCIGGDGCDVSTAKGFANFAERVALSRAHAMTRITTDEGLTLGPPIGAAECIFTLGFASDQLRQHLDVPDRCEAGAARWG